MALTESHAFHSCKGPHLLGECIGLLEQVCSLPSVFGLHPHLGELAQLSCCLHMALQSVSVAKSILAVAIEVLLPALLHATAVLLVRFQMKVTS